MLMSPTTFLIKAMMKIPEPQQGSIALQFLVVIVLSASVITLSANHSGVNIHPLNDEWTEV